MNLRDGIGVSLVIAFIAALGVLFWKAIPPANEQLIVYMLGQLSGFAAGIIAYHYTLTAGAKDLEEKRADNTKAAFAAISAALPNPPSSTVTQTTTTEVEEAKK